MLRLEPRQSELQMPYEWRAMSRSLTNEIEWRCSLCMSKLCVVAALGILFNKSIRLMLMAFTPQLTSRIRSLRTRKSLKCYQHGGKFEFCWNGSESYSLFTSFYHHIIVLGSFDVPEDYTTYRSSE